jgi:hypothetical protein
MPEFTPGTPIKTDAPKIEVTVTPLKPLRPGRHVFTLSVVDDAGNASRNTAEFTVIVVDGEAPTAVLDGPARVAFGTSFVLTGERSTDVGGTIKTYIFTLKE